MNLSEPAVSVCLGQKTGCQRTEVCGLLVGQVTKQSCLKSEKCGAPLGRQLCVHAAFVSCAKDGIEDRKEHPEEYYMNGRVP